MPFLLTGIVQRYQLSIFWIRGNCSGRFASIATTTSKRQIVQSRPATFTNGQYVFTLKGLHPIFDRATAVFTVASCPCFNGLTLRHCGEISHRKAA